MKKIFGTKEIRGIFSSPVIRNIEMKFLRSLCLERFFSD